MHRFWLTQARPQMTSHELDWMRRVSMREPRPPAMLRYALAAGLNGRPDEAALTLARLCHLHPAERCDEGRASWHSAQEKYPALRAVAFPTTSKVRFPESIPPSRGDSAPYRSRKLLVSFSSSPISVSPALVKEIADSRTVLNLPMPSEMLRPQAGPSSASSSEGQRRFPRE